MECGTANKGKWWCWAADRPVSGLGMTPIPGQKQLRGKTVKTRHGMQYKKGFSYAQ